MYFPYANNLKLQLRKNGGFFYNFMDRVIIIIIIIFIIISFMQGIYTYILETNYVPRELQCCSYSAVTIHGAYIVSFSVESIVLLH